MGEVKVPVIVENAFDRERCFEGELLEEKIRSEQIKALVDTGATMLMLPQEIVERLGLRIRGKVIVTYADERKEERPRAGIVTVKVGERDTDVDCVVGHPNSEPLVGQIVLEAMDLLVDCTNRQLTPRPESPYLPLLKLK
ncbi:MAG: retropepsin-like aspartic protease [bacterium]|nr:retropepsin-like aspartic protease [bacterium]